MNTLHDFHLQAMEFAESALGAKKRGADDDTIAFFRQALEFERKALESVERDLREGMLAAMQAEPTRSVLYRSAASLALNCGELREAERLIAAGLAGNPPDEIAEELRDLFDDVSFARHLDQRGIALQPREIQLSIAGNAVGRGIAESDEFFGRAMDTEKLIFRTAERKQGLPFRERGPAKRKARPDYALYVSVPRAASFAVTFRLGGLQQTLPGFEEPEAIVDEVLSCLEIFERSGEEELRSRISDEAYYRNFVGLTRRILPDGVKVSLVGITGMRGGSEVRIALRKQVKGVTQKIEKISPNGDTPIVRVTGQLRFADDRHPSKGEIILVDSQDAEHRVIVPEGMMDDIVRPLWKDTVQVIGTRKGKRILLNEIDPVRGSE